jgi:hypothetical protein
MVGREFLPAVTGGAWRASSWIPAFLCGSTTLAKLRPSLGEMTALSGA